MSIWGTFATIGEDDEGDTDGSIRDYREGQSNRYPNNTEAHGRLYLGLAPWWCVPGWDDTIDHDGLEDGSVGKWLQLSAFRSDAQASVYMHEAAVKELYHCLGEWLMLPKIDPKETT